MSGPLQGLHVLELCDETGSFAGKLLGDAGADVVKVEPPGGESSRHYPPFAGDVEDLNRSLYFWSRNTSKRSMAIDISVEQGAALAAELMACADVVLESAPPGTLAARGLGYDDVAARNPGVVYVLLASGVACLLAMLAIMRWSRHPRRAHVARYLEDSVAGSGVGKAQRFLDEIAAFAREP